VPHFQLVFPRFQEDRIFQRRGADARPVHPHVGSGDVHRHRHDLGRRGLVEQRRRLALRRALLRVLRRAPDVDREVLRRFAKLPELKLGRAEVAGDRVVLLQRPRAQEGGVRLRPSLFAERLQPFGVQLAGFHRQGFERGGGDGRGRGG